MTTDNSQQFLFYLRQYGISNTMITILEKQHINDEDLQMIDRDDVDHLFRNEYGFTFRDRKHFWNILQKIQLSQVPNLKNEQIINSTEILDYIYEFGEEEDEDIDNTHSKEQSFLSSTSNTDRQSTNTNLFDNKILSDDKNGNDEDNNSNSSSYVSNVSLSADYVFTYPTVLPSFSANITQALKTNTIHKQWAPFINELARWVMSIKPSLREQHEYRAIGQTLYEKYPDIGTAGPKPWSFLCRSLSQRIRTERWQRRKTLVAQTRKENEMKKTNHNCYDIQSEIIL